MGPPELMAEGMSVLLDVNGEKTTFMTIRKNQRVKVGKGFFSLSPLIGQPFGAVFEMQATPGEGSHLVRLPTLTGAQLAEAEATRQDEDAQDQGEETPVSAPAAAAAALRDNRALLDDNRAQGLSAAEIEDLKQSGASGSAIIAALCANSASFHTKTEFSQEKYLRKKQKKYAPRLTARRPTAASVCAAYFAKAPGRTGHLRVDTLGLMLSLGNVGAWARVLVLDECGGLPTAAVAERLGGHGSVCAATFPPRPSSIDIGRSFNFDPTTAAGISRCSLRDLVAARTAAAAADVAAADVAAANIAAADVASADAVSAGEAAADVATVDVADSDMATADVAAADVAAVDAAKVAGAEADRRKGGHGKMGRPAEDCQVKAWAESGFSSAIIAAPSLSPLTAARCVMPLLAPSSPIVIYHPHLQPLTECMAELQKEKSVVGLQLIEPWLREHQVLPQRSHPVMQMSATGGYLLHGITLARTTTTTVMTPSL